MMFDVYKEARRNLLMNYEVIDSLALRIESKTFIDLMFEHTHGGLYNFTIEDDFYCNVSDHEIKLLIAHSPHLLRFVKHQTEELIFIFLEANKELKEDSRLGPLYIDRFVKVRTPTIVKEIKRLKLLWK